MLQIGDCRTNQTMEAVCRNGILKTGRNDDPIYLQVVASSSEATFVSLLRSWSMATDPPSTIYQAASAVPSWL